MSSSLIFQQMFKGIKVLELASVLAGPSVGQFFAELGATVIKVENPNTGGDVTRSWRQAAEKQETGAYFSAVNWGKMSWSLDITQTKGLEQLYKMTSQCDIVIASYKPGDAERLKVDYQSLKKYNTSLIYGCISGYGPSSSRVGYDAIIQAEAGFMTINGERGSSPLKMPVALMDLLAGHQLKEALLLAYIHKIRSGEGSEVQVSLIEAAVTSLANQATNWLVAGQEPVASGSAHPNIAPYGDVFISKDNKALILAIGTDKQFDNLCNILGLPVLPQFDTNTKRLIQRADLNRILAQAIGKFKADQLLNELASHHVPAGRINKVSEAVALEEVKALKLSHQRASGLRTFVAHASHMEKSSHFLPPPHLGEHNDYIQESFLA